MKILRKGPKQNLSSRINKAGFVSTESKNIESFKYNLICNIKHRCSATSISIKRYLNSRRQSVLLQVRNVDWNKVGVDSWVWCIETMVEGVSLNFATHYLLGTPFNMMTAFAHGIVVKQGLSIYWRLRVNGTTSKLPTKHDKYP